MEIIHLDKDLKVKVKCMKSNTSVEPEQLKSTTKNVCWSTLFIVLLNCFHIHLKICGREIINHNGALNYDSGQRQSCDLAA